MQWFCSERLAGCLHMATTGTSDIVTTTINAIHNRNAVWVVYTVRRAAVCGASSPSHDGWVNH